jgi:hypothetical protein
MSEYLNTETRSNETTFKSRVLPRKYLPNEGEASAQAAEAINNNNITGIIADANLFLLT